MDQGGVLISRGRVLFSRTFLMRVIVQNIKYEEKPYTITRAMMMTMILPLLMWIDYKLSLLLRILDLSIWYKDGIEVFTLNYYVLYYTTLLMLYYRCCCCHSCYCWICLSIITTTITFFLSTLLYIYIYIYIYMCVYWYNSFVILLMLLFVVYVYTVVYTINYILYGWQWERYKHIASFLLPCLLLLIVIYDWVGTYSTMKRLYWIGMSIIMMLDCQPSCWIYYHVCAQPLPQW